MYECESELRRGPWTLEEDNLLIQYVSSHGEGRWNSLAKFAVIFHHSLNLYTNFMKRLKINNLFSYVFCVQG